jgi:hypothetical protein
VIVEHSAQALVKVIREVKNDQARPKIQQENYERQLR